jgi:hypothetical protein
MKKLRLLLFDKCNRSCEGCCNNDYDLNKLPIETDFSIYRKIFLTGGEPMLDPYKIMKATRKIRSQNPECGIYLYTAMVTNINFVMNILHEIDGITLTLHDNSDVLPFRKFNHVLWGYDLKYKSMRLNIFKKVIIHPFDIPYFWKIKKDIKWIKNCPLPPGEVFKKFEY